MSQAYKTEHNFSDYREMLDKLGDRIDAVTVSIPDHNHAVAAAKAMKMGKHVYCQKPLTHSIWEARRLGEIAKEKGVATQMGNQWTAFDPHAQGRVSDSRRPARHGEGSAYLDEPPDLAARRSAPPAKPVPSTLNWEAWIGPAPFRPYAEGYHPFAWRGWWDFGTGALGDMACHTCNLPFMALNMRDPVAVEAECPEHDGDSYPARSKIKFEFPELGGRPAFTMYWYDGGNLPARELFKDVTLTTKTDEGKDVPPPYQSGVLLIGDKAKMYAAGDYADSGIQIVGADEDGRRLPAEPRPRKGMVHRDAGSEEAGDVELPELCRPADRDDPARQPGRVQARPRRMGSGEPQAAERSVAGEDRAARVPRRVRSVMSYTVILSGSGSTSAANRIPSCASNDRSLNRLLVWLYRRLLHPAAEVADADDRPEFRLPDPPDAVLGGHAAFSGGRSRSKAPAAADRVRSRGSRGGPSAARTRPGRPPSTVLVQATSLTTAALAELTKLLPRSSMPSSDFKYSRSSSASIFAFGLSSSILALVIGQLVAGEKSLQLVRPPLRVNAS